MPDWSYRTILRPLLFQLPPETARDVTLTAMGTLAAIPFGSTVIDMLGHMQPSPDIQRQVLGLTLPSPVGLGAGLDVNAVAVPALARFGFGFVEIGPVTLNLVCAPDKIERQVRQRAIGYPDAPVNPGVEAITTRLARYGPISVPLGIRLAHRPSATAVEATDERAALIGRLMGFASFFTLEYQTEQAQWTIDEWSDHIAALVETLRRDPAPRPLLLCLRADLEWDKVGQIVDVALERGISGIVVSGGVAATPAGRVVGLPAREKSLEMIRCIRSRWGEGVTIIGSGGILQPQDALQFLDAGATLVQIHSGLVYSGPGLPKRINEAISYYQPPVPTSPPARRKEPILNVPDWAWIGLLAFGLIFSGIIIWIVAITRTVLPYDEAFVGLSRADLLAINERLLPFMAHDRVTVSGTMIATGVLYAGLALFGMRRGSDWARQVILISGASGFLSFFLFLGFGYFDPVHALLTAGLLPLFLLGMFARRKTVPDKITPPNLTNNGRWLSGQWGQLAFIFIGFGLVMAGFAITSVGVVNVFVPEDLKFLNTTADVLRAANAHLVPLIAHDRVGFGGNLISVGLALLPLSLWGFRQGERWVWWTLLLAGTPGFVAGVGIHIAVGYLDALHLFPAFVALALFVVGLWLSYPLLCHPDKPYRQPISSQTG